MAKKQSISSRLFRPYALLFGLFFAVLVVIFIIYTTYSIEGKLVETQRQLSDNIRENIENYFMNMNDFSISLMNSTEFCQIAVQDLPQAYVSGQSDLTGILFSELYLRAYQMFERGYQIGIRTDSGYYIWMGNTYFISRIDGDIPDIYQDYDGSSHMMLMKLDANPYLLREIEHSDDKYLTDPGPVITLSRSINSLNVFGYRQAMLEIQIPAGELDRLLARLVVQSQNGLKVNLYDAYGDPIYEQLPMKDPKLVDGLLKQKQHNLGENIVEVMPLLDGNLYMVSFIPVSQHYANMARFLALAILIGASLILLMLFITYKISSRISGPIGEMCRQIQRLDYEVADTDSLKKVSTDIHELDFLAQTISGLHHKLRESLGQIVQLESYEIQSQLLALQAQMQPHFLYNTLMTMSAIAQSNEDYEVTQICYNLTGMLRYMAEKNSDGVSIAIELQHLENYIQIMRIRFPNLDIDVRIPMSMMAIQIPKLIIQPLVENSLKYCNREQCRIELKGSVSEGRWRIRICDNGIGFTGDKIRQLYEQFDRISRDHTLASRKIGGLGLENIYMRLKLFYKEDMLFTIADRPEGGACIEIGGLTKKENGQ
ncbi:sensor histidine kinase [Diplocloster hominis]|uniref:sensor histidine kinase n=1 Tax=Diplocloster hominis TaxID=3079010 RepID=UPI0031BBA2B5